MRRRWAHCFVQNHFSYGHLASILPFASACLHNLRMTRGQNDSRPLLCKYRMTNSCQEAHPRRHFHRFAKVSRIHEHLQFDPFQPSLCK
jgi:hypothetical protein